VDSQNVNPREDTQAAALLPPPAAASDPVEAALAKALQEASAAGRFDVVAQLAGELQARREARAGAKVVPLDAKRLRGA
jgi:hypothetical protein